MKGSMEPVIGSLEFCMYLSSWFTLVNRWLRGIPATWPEASVLGIREV